MKALMKKMVTIVATFAIAFASLPATFSNLNVHAASIMAPAQVKNLNATSVTQTSVKLSWSKIAKNRNTKGYAIYRNGKLIKRVSYKINTFTNTKLKAGTKYSFTVRAYNSYIQIQYYNSKTKKWQAKRPPTSQWKGKKTRKVTAYKYGKVSATKQVTTKKAVKKTTNINKPSTGGPPTSGLSSQDIVIDTNLNAISSRTISIKGNNPILSVSYNPGGGDVSWTSADTSAVKIKSVKNANGISTATLEGGSKSADNIRITATYNKKVSGARYTGNAYYTFSANNIQVYSCTNLKLDNKLPIYDYSYPKFDGVPDSSVKKVLDFDAKRNVERALISCNISPALTGKEKVEFYNKTTGSLLYGPSSSGMFGAPLDKGFDITKPADASVSEVISIMNDFGFATRLESGKMLFAVELEQGAIVSGNNVIELRINDNSVATVTVNVKSRANRYYEFARSVSENARPSWYSPEDKKCTGDVTLLRKLRGIKDYINDQYEYPACVKSSFGNASVVTIGNIGRQVDSMLGGCEDGAIMMTICAMYNGVDATYQYVNGHCICVLANSNNLFGFDITFDATPHSGYYTSASQDRIVEYLKTISKILR